MLLQDRPAFGCVQRKRGMHQVADKARSRFVQMGQQSQGDAAALCG